MAGIISINGISIQIISPTSYAGTAKSNVELLPAVNNTVFATGTISFPIKIRNLALCNRL